MIAFIKDDKLEMIKKKFILLYLLNVMDIIFTVLLLRTGYFAEVNLLMLKVLQSPAASIFLKIIMPAILLYMIYKHMRYSDILQRKAANVAVNISLIIYALVNLSHMVWAVLLPVFLLKS